jgi:UDP-3-O-[3-hydroxymyristoyl] glucosamine N-acyltransferase
LRLGEIARLLGGEVLGDPEVEIRGVSGVEDAREGDITFALGKKMAALASQGRAACIMVKEPIAETDKAQLKVDDPHYAFAVLLGHFYGRPRGPAGISGLAFVAEGAALAEGVSVHAFAYVSDGVSIGKRSVIYPGVFLGEGVMIGEDCAIHPNVVLREGVSVGDRVIIHAGTVVGADGFGYIQRGGTHHKVPQVGGVTIGDDVEIGANVTIDRATTGVTAIGRGTKIDNLVQVAHNVKVGENSILVAQSGIAGSSVIGNSVVLAGQTGVSDHVKIESGTVIGAQSGVMSDLSRGFYSGSPAMPHREWLKAVSLFARLPELSKRIQALEDRIKEMERRQGDDKHQ